MTRTVTGSTISNARPRLTSSRDRELVTPEGVALVLTLASRYERIVAALIDAAIVVFCPAFLVFLLNLLIPIGSSSAWMILLALFSFLFRFCYYPITEIRWRGQTVGKRLLRLRVIYCDGAPLMPTALIARNATRDVEFWLPMTLIVVLTESTPESWLYLSILSWSAALMFLMLFNRDSMRAGDLLAGTWVIAEQKPEVFADLAKLLVLTEPQRSRIYSSGRSSNLFTPAQLSLYGVYELEVLADLLRKRPRVPAQTVTQVAQQIKAKIAWSTSQEIEDWEFLLTYYEALRQYLEHQNLVKGVRPSDKQAALQINE